MAIRFFDMFSGIGGFRSGLTTLGGFECVGHCEIDKYANKAYCAMYETRGEQYYEDARSISDKIELAKMFGITDISVWRIGAIPNGSADTYMNIWDTIDNMR